MMKIMMKKNMKMKNNIGDNYILCNIFDMAIRIQ